MIIADIGGFIRLKDEGTECMADKLDLDKTYFVMSYVPSFHDKPYWLRDKAKNYLWVYCDNVHAEGIFVEEIEEAVKEGG